MIAGSRPFSYLDHDSSLPGPGPGPTPPGSFYLSRFPHHLRSFDGKILGRTNDTAPSNASMTGIEAAPGWLTDTLPGRVPSEPDWGPFFQKDVSSKGKGEGMDRPCTTTSTVNDSEPPRIRLRSPNAQRLHRYRERRPRIDFYPSPDVLAIVLHHRKAGLDPTLAGIIDGLIRIGHQALNISGNGKN